MTVWGLAASAWATKTGYPVIEHADDPLLVITTGVPSFPADASEMPRLSDRTFDEHVGTAAAPAFENPVSKPTGEKERTTVPLSATNVRMPLAK